MIIKLLLIVFVVFVVSRILVRFRAGDITRREFFAWIFFWLLVVSAIIWSQETDLLAKLVGVGRGVDLLIYLSILTLFFVMFKVIVHLEKIDRQIVKLISALALSQKIKNDD